MATVPFAGAVDPQVLLSILEELPTGVWVARAPKGEFVYANRTFVEIMGMAPRDDVRAGDYTDGYRLRDREGRPFPEERLPFAQALARRETVVVDDIVIEQPDGRGVRVRAFGKPILDAAGEVSLVVVSFIDITAEAAAAAAGAVAQHKLQTALQHAPIVLFATDVGGIVTISEGAALEAMGFKPGELVGQSIHDLYKDTPLVLQNHERALAGETFTVTADLGNVVLESWLSPMRGAKGEIGGVLGVATDVTERLRMQRQVNQADRLAALGRLAASVAHEINNPRDYALGALRLAREAVGGVDDDARVKVGELVDQALSGMERVRFITRDLKSFSRADEDERRPQDLHRAISAATKMVATRVGARAHVELALGPTATVLADENRLVQIFVNLVLNAADALPAGNAEGNRITLRGRLDGAHVVIEVADNGPGVPADQRARVFDPFFTTKPVGEGTGLGLFVTRNLVEALGGTITLAEAPGGGALFTLRLPVVATPVADAPPAAVPARAAGRARVVVIEDEPQLAQLFSRSLEGAYDVTVFTSGRAALGHLLEGPPYDLVLCDLMMADISGMKVFEEVRRARPGLERAFVFMTGGVFDPRVADFLASIPNECVDKPFDVRAVAGRRLTAP
jgi:two-component system cell cycle sensor histidine kinase/response regulator CckA